MTLTLHPVAAVMNRQSRWRCPFAGLSAVALVTTWSILFKDFLPVSFSFLGLVCKTYLMSAHKLAPRYLQWGVAS
jgi:hypothetical protein